MTSSAPRQNSMRYGRRPEKAEVTAATPAEIDTATVRM